jgi:hypothetical protein
VSTPPDYVPGACNIGGDERRRRYRLGALSLVAAVGYAAAVAVLAVPTALAVGLFVPFSLGIEFLLQGRRSFCASMGFRGRYESGDGDGRATDEEALSADRRYALELTLLGTVGGAALTAVATGLLYLA